VYEITKEAICFYLAVWAVAFVATFARSVRDNEFISFWHNTALSFTSGLFSFGSVCVLGVDPTDSGHSPWYWLGMSALIGLFAKEQDKIAKTVLSNAIGGLKTVLVDQDRKEDNKDA
jgi:hypothetical protein